MVDAKTCACGSPAVAWRVMEDDLFIRQFDNYDAAQYARESCLIAKAHLYAPAGGMTEQELDGVLKALRSRQADGHGFQVVGVCAAFPRCAGVQV